MTAAYIASWVWLALEIGLVVRDRWQHRGSRARDAGTRRLIALVVASGMVVAIVVAVTLPDDSALRLPGTDTSPWASITGVTIMVIGLVVRVWAIVVLGASFRTTVEVDAGQNLVQRGPYRVVRHPSYTGALLVAAGFGLAMGNAVSLAVAIALPLLVFARRVVVEERAMVETLGRPYEEYRTRTARLVPGLW